MKRTILIKVSEQHGIDFRVLYQNSVELDSNLEFPYSKVLDVLRLLYPHPNLVINFEVFV